MMLHAWCVPWGPICGAASSKLGTGSQGSLWGHLGERSMKGAKVQNADKHLSTWAPLSQFSSFGRGQVLNFALNQRAHTLQALLPLPLGDPLSPLRSRLKSCNLLISLSILFRMVFSRASRLEEALVRLSWASESRWTSLSSCKRQTEELRKGRAPRVCAASKPLLRAQAALLAITGKTGQDKSPEQKVQVATVAGSEACSLRGWTSKQGSCQLSQGPNAECTQGQMLEEAASRVIQ